MLFGQHLDRWRTQHLAPATLAVGLTDHRHHLVRAFYEGLERGHGKIRRAHEDDPQGCAHSSSWRIFFSFFL